MVIKEVFFIVSFMLLLSACNPANRNLPVNPAMMQNPVNQNVNANEFCNWGFTGPGIFECRGKRYAHGTTVCPSGTYKNIFCEERLSTSGRACQADQSPDTVACRQQFQQSHANNQGEHCKWGFGGPKRFQCDGKTYVHGFIRCASGSTDDLFCEARYANSISACQNDESLETIDCHMFFLDQLGD